MKLLIIPTLIFATVAMATDIPPKEKTWYTGEVQQEGFPLLLRFPEKPDFDALQKKYPRLVVVRHQLEKVKPSGLPEADYNDSLADLDHALITAFSDGVAVLVETFGGRRNYYIYASSEAKVDEVKQTIAARYPTANLSWSVKEDSSWKFIRRYSDEYRFYRKG